MQQQFLKPLPAVKELGKGDFDLICTDFQISVLKSCEGLRRVSSFPSTNKISFNAPEYSTCIIIINSIWYCYGKSLFGSSWCCWPHLSIKSCISKAQFTQGSSVLPTCFFFIFRKIVLWKNLQRISILISNFLICSSQDDQVEDYQGAWMPLKLMVAVMDSKILIPRLSDHLWCYLL